MPAFNMAGHMLLAAKDSLALSPDGHGGSLRALHKSGALADMRKRGVEHLSYFQVDNPLVHCIDPLFLGLHDLSGSEMSSKTIPKAGPLEKVGNFVTGDGVLQVIEYSDLPETSGDAKECGWQLEIQCRVDRDSCVAGFVHRAAERRRAIGIAVASGGEESSIR